MPKGYKRKNGFYWVLSFHDVPCIARFTTPDNWFVPGDPDVYNKWHFKEVSDEPVTFLENQSIKELRNGLIDFYVAVTTSEILPGRIPETLKKVEALIQKYK